MVATIALLLLLLGAVAAALVRSGPGYARAGALAAMVAVALSALAPPRPEAVAVPARVGIACSHDAEQGGVLAAVQGQLQREDGATARCVAAAALPEGLARAVLFAGPRADEVLAVWNGALADAPPLAAPVAGSAFTTAAALPWPPEALTLRAVGTPRADRPLRFDVAIAAAAAHGARANVQITAAGAAPRTFTVDVPPVGAAAVDAGTLPAGDLELQATAVIGATTIERRGRASVAAPPRVIVLEPSGVIAAALRAQGVVADAVTALPAALDESGCLILGAPLAVADQERLRAAVEGGLGLFALGPGLQQAGEPLRALWPVRVRAGSNGGRGDRPDPTRPPEPSHEPPRDPSPDAPPPADKPPDSRPPDSKPPDGPRDQKPPIEPGGPVDVDKHAIAMVFVVDRSGSMGARLPGGATKMSFVKTSALRTAEVLGEGDAVAIVTFGSKDQGRVVLPLTAATDRAAVRAGVEGLAHAREYTYLLAGLRLARELLAPSRVAVRHVVVLTDGEYEASEQLPLRDLAAAMRRQGMTVSVVSIVDRDTDPGFLANCEAFARDGGGLFLPVSDATRVPQLVSAEVVRALDRVGRRPARPASGDEPLADATPPPQPPPADRSPPTPQPPTPGRPAEPQRLVVRAVAKSPLLLPDTVNWPVLLGASAEKAEFDAHVLLIAGDDGLPVLAYCNRGLGRVGVFAADLAGADGEEFRRDGAFPARLSQWVAATARAVAAPAVDLLATTRVTPPAPTPAAVAQLRAASGSEPRPLGELRLPPPRTAFVHRSQVPAWAAIAALLLVALATLEWWAVRRGH